ncbi:efflux RND transporter periplasmic adaptor subunit [Pelodictyon phaeoclathratiforme]|jgi:HlyD family secretion protein|uniref:Efflux transporter, RND family, MFP subunit n=1 Tax=Pelodictyon phaeoclathratiforme (strain DSM 5477 / BU-1) TaxID=324925 RepID=B4SH79_PELPB|nr:efflux RND transporter periplasmic adaptor subunit [Pelodictyon phaeoclathratiforme]ACF43546.1 efflux transporter, RND family, MFP subunit [Pelodictyon phaeoclathratiforme BU-1]MBV5289155.1 efflux RND transporter periplasmic adaptor subunit [Pelodictyon phaeoclathratiforme]
MVFSKTQRIAGISVAVAALILFFVFRPSPLPVDSGVVSRGPLQVTLEGEGVTRVNDRFVLAAPVSGKLVRVELEEGDHVRKGSVVASLLPAQLDSREYREASSRAGSARAALDEAIARQRRADLTLVQAERRFGRYRNLYGEGAVSKESYELAENEAQTLRKERDAARSGVEAARYNLGALQALVDRQVAGQPVKVLSPVDGRVLRIHEQSERVVSAGSPLVDIGDPSAIEIVIDLLSSDAIRVKPGNRVVIMDWGGERELQGVVKTVDPAAFTKTSALGIEEKRVNIVALLSRNEPLLGDNFRVQASIVLREASAVLQVPVSSLFRGKEGWHLFVLEDGRAVDKAVRIGMRGTLQAQVLAGVREGQKVVVHPTNELRDGMSVKAQE